MDPWNPLLTTVALAHGSPMTNCPDCESHWDRAVEDHCATCGLSLDDLRDRLERRAR